MVYALAPQMARVPQMGDWWAACCAHDLQQISTAEDLAVAREWREDALAGEGAFVGSWTTLDEARAYLTE